MCPYAPLMPIFARRRLQAMLNDLAPRGGDHKLGDLRARLESKRVDQALPAEVELAVLWALTALGEFEIEPAWFGNSRPDAYTEHLFEGVPCVVEITAVSDGRLSQDDDMRRVAARLCAVANQIRKGAGKHLYFQFDEEHGYTTTGFVRRRRVDKDFDPTDATLEQLRTWLSSRGDGGEPLHLTQGRTHVVVSWRRHPQHTHSNFFSTMPAEAYSLEDNPLHEALKAKARQLSSPDFQGLRCIIVADVGSRLLRLTDYGMRSPGTVTGKQIITHFLKETDGAVDVVVVLTAQRGDDSLSSPERPVRWRAATLVHPAMQVKESGVTRMLASLPPPRFEGYQARSLHQQAAYRPDGRGWYVGTSIISKGSRMTFKVSARALLDLLAGHITQEQFQQSTGLKDKPGSRNILSHRLEQGDILSKVQIESGGLDEDDDWLVLEFTSDPSAAPLRVPKR